MNILELIYKLNSRITYGDMVIIILVSLLTMVTLTAMMTWLASYNVDGKNEK